MMLIKAEALIQKGPEYYTEAFMLINYVNKRANDVTTTSRGDTLKLKDYTESKVQMEELLLAERQREFMFEGKRWFDLVRIARRDGNNNRLVTLATRKYIEAGKDLAGKGFDPRKLLADGVEAIKATVKEKMELFGSVNKA